VLGEPGCGFLDGGVVPASQKTPFYFTDSAGKAEKAPDLSLEQRVLIVHWLQARRTATKGDQARELGEQQRREHQNLSAYPH